MDARTLKVPGAELYYEVRGSGPVLLLVCGGIYDAAGYAGLAGRLADRYTVVTYDRRGNSRSPLDEAGEAQRVEVHGDDAHRLLDAVGAPAYVFGNSSGAIIGLELATRHPEQVRVLVAHEPPLFDLLPDHEHWRAVIDEMETTFAANGAEAALGVLNAAFEADRGGRDAGLEGRMPGGGDAPRPEEMDAETAAMMGRLAKNMEFFAGYEVPGFNRYQPDLEAIQVPVVAAISATAGDEPPGRAAKAVAARVGAETVVFPGDHGGFGSEAEPFAAQLAKVLASR